MLGTFIFIFACLLMTVATDTLYLMIFAANFYLPFLLFHFFQHFLNQFVLVHYFLFAFGVT